MQPSDGSLYENTTNPQFKNVNFFIAKNISAQTKSGIRNFRQRRDAARTLSRQRPRHLVRPDAGSQPAPEAVLAFPMKDLILCIPVSGCFWECSHSFWPQAQFLFTPQTRMSLPWQGRLPAQDRSTMLLEAMKEEVFQLESDRLQGKIKPEDYQTAKSALDKTLQRAVQRQPKAT